MTLRKETAGPVIEARNLGKTYRVEERRIRILEDVSLFVERGEFLVIAGASGSGKTTLLSLLSGLDSPDEGRISIDGHDITGFSEDDLAPLRNRTFGFVFQAFHLVPSLTALENVAFPARLAGDRQARERAAELLSRVGLAERGGSFPRQLSGGEKQRVALCRALINHPVIVFADEPTGNLDAEASEEVMALLMDLRAETGVTLVMVTHNAAIARRADRVAIIAGGRLAPAGTAFPGLPGNGFPPGRVPEPVSTPEAS